MNQREEIMSQEALDESGFEEKLNEEVNLLAKKWLHSDVDKIDHHITFTDFMANKILLVRVIREGVPYSLFNVIQLFSPLNTAYWIALLSMSSHSLRSFKKSDKHFKSWRSEKIIGIAEVSHLGMEVFENKDKFRLWLEAPSYALGNLSPLELLKDSYGKDLVMGELTRINYGILA